MPTLEIMQLVALVSAAIGSFETNSLIAALATTVGVWILIFGYYVSAGSAKPQWQFGGAVRRVVLLWSWLWVAAAVGLLLGWWAFFAWRLSSGLILIPTAPNESAPVVFGYGMAPAAAMLLIGWVPRLFLPALKIEPPQERHFPSRVDEEEQDYRPLYPELSFDNPYAPQPVTRTVVEEPPVVEEKKPRRGRVAVAAALGVAVVAGALAFVIAPSAPKAYQQFALSDLRARLSDMFADRSGDVIADDAVRFDLASAPARQGDFAADIDAWQLLAAGGNTAAQYKLGVMYANGRGVERDYVAAHKWLNIAGARGDERAVAGRDAVARRMTPAEIADAQTQARAVLASLDGGFSLTDLPPRLTRMSPRELVGEAQKLLNARGFSVGAPDGIAGPRTRAAVREFERQNGIAPTGTITPELVFRLSRVDQAQQHPALDAPAVLVSTPGLAPLSTPPARRPAPPTECDRLAAHPSAGPAAGDVDGVVFERIDAARAIPACEQASRQYPEELRFQYQLARSLHKAERHDEALALYSKAGDQGFALAQRSVGFMYANGSGVPQNLAKAAQWLHQAAERCDVDAQFALGKLYANGQGVRQDQTESLRWYRIAAARAHPDARNKLKEIAAAPNGSPGPAAPFEPSDDTAARHIEKILANPENGNAAALQRGDYATVLETVRPRAEQGDASAQTLLGILYRAGHGVAQDDGAAAEWFRKAAEQDDPDAQFLLGYMYQRGLGISQYAAAALQWYRKSAGLGVAAARANLGVMYNEGQGIARDREEALAQFFSAAEAGIAGAQHNLAQAYETGGGVARDLEEALKWYRLAAAQGFALSQNRLGELYAAGKGVSRDLDQAVGLFQQAADQGLPEAQFNLAKSFAAGRGVPQDPSAAMKFYAAAAERGHVDGQVSLGLAKLTGRGAERDVDEAARWLRRAAEQCNADAQFQLANLYRVGRGVAQASAAEELKWLKLAAEQGHAEALQALSVRYTQGSGTVKDPTRALRSMRRAAERGQAAAQFNLAEAYAAGSEALPQDYAKAAEWYMRSAQQGNREAQFKLARLYREGLGVPRSYVAAVEWYRKAAAAGDARAQYSLATAYRLGAGVPGDPVQAVHWYRQAAAQDDAGAQRELGLLYLRGTGVLQDFVQARLWLGRAASHGDVQANEELARLAKKMTAEQIAEADRQTGQRSDQDG